MAAAVATPPDHRSRPDSPGRHSLPRCAPAPAGLSSWRGRPVLLVRDGHNAGGQSADRRQRMRGRWWRGCAGWRGGPRQPADCRPALWPCVRPRLSA